MQYSLILKVVNLVKNISVLDECEYEDYENGEDYEEYGDKDINYEQSGSNEESRYSGEEENEDYNLCKIQIFEHH